MRRKPQWLALLLVLGLILAACGDGGSGDTTTTAAAEEEPTTTAAPALTRNIARNPATTATMNLVDRASFPAASQLHPLSIAAPERSRTHPDGGLNLRAGSTQKSDQPVSSMPKQPWQTMTSP